MYQPYLLSTRSLLASETSCSISGGLRPAAPSKFQLTPRKLSWKALDIKCPALFSRLSVGQVPVGHWIFFSTTSTTLIAEVSWSYSTHHHHEETTRTGGRKLTACLEKPLSVPASSPQVSAQRRHPYFKSLVPPLHGRAWACKLGYCLVYIY
jgi:hypothetical protein